MTEPATTVPAEEARKMLALLSESYSALSAIIRLGYPLDEGWPVHASEAFENLGDYLWPGDLKPDAWERLLGKEPDNGPA